MNYYKNIAVNYVFTFFKSIDVTNGIWMLYLASKGLSLFEIGLLEGIFHVTSLVMETPTGAVADIFGRKMSRLVGMALSVGSRVLMIFSGSFAMFALSFVITALSYNFESGAGEALVYDSLLLEKKEHKYLKVAGRNELIFQSTNILGLVLGGFAGNIKYEYAYIIAIALNVAAFITGLLFKEPLITKTKCGIVGAVKKQYRDSFAAVKGSRRLFYLILFTGILSASVTLSFYYLQIAWEGGTDVFGIGLYLAASSAAAAAGAALAEKAEKALGESAILKITPVLIALSVISMYFTDFALIPLCAISALETIVFVATRDYINRLIPSDKRATILSFESMMCSVVMILIFPLFGLVSDNLGMGSTFLMLGGAMAAMALVNLKVTGSRAANEEGADINAAALAQETDK
ncbi:MAG: MFS transporter [Burkholderiales bacterium]